jgi:hypothetical protein
MTELQKLTVAQLRRVISIKEKIESLSAQLNALSGGEAPASQKRPGRRKMSRAAKAAIAAAQRARWAKVKAAKAEVAPKKRRKMSTAAKAKIAAAAKTRWAKAKAQGKNKL